MVLPRVERQEEEAISLQLRIRRFDPEVAPDPWWQDFTVRSHPMDRLLDALHEVKWEQDGTLTFRRSCGHGVCGSDAMMINGRNRLACKILVGDVAPKVVIKPIRGLPVLKDLVVDMEPFFAGVRRILPFMINEDGTSEHERTQSPEERNRYDDTTKCILCAACTSSCPSYWAQPSYVGPAAIVNAHRFIFDSRDDATDMRLDLMAHRDGVWHCRTIFNCVEACPRGINVTGAILEVTAAIVERDYPWPP